MFTGLAIKAFFGGLLKNPKALLLIILVVVSGYALYTYRHAIMESAGLKVELSTANQSIVNQENQIKTFNEDSKKVDGLKNDAVDFERTTTDNVLKVETTLNRVDIDKLARDDIQLANHVVNKKTSELFRCFELISGSKLNEENDNDEKNPLCGNVVRRNTN